MSKSKLGGGALFFLGLAANFLDVSAGWRLILCVLALAGAVIWFVGFLGADDTKRREGEGVNVSGQGMSGNVVAAGRDAIQTIHHHGPPDNLSATVIYDRLDEFVQEGGAMFEHFLNGSSPYPSEEMVENWSNQLIEFASKHAKIEERNRLRKCYPWELKDEEAMEVVGAPIQFYEIMKTLQIRLKIIQQIMYRLRQEQ